MVYYSASLQLAHGYYQYRTITKNETNKKNMGVIDFKELLGTVTSLITKEVDNRTGPFHKAQINLNCESNLIG